MAESPRVSTGDSAQLDFFRKTGFLYEGEELFELAGTDGEIAGALAVLRDAGDVDVVPLIAARANSTGPLSDDCYRYLRGRLLELLVEAGSVDGVILSHHGSMTSVSEDDTEGDIAAAARQIIGPMIPLLITLDLHANVTGRMVASANAVIGYREYPHSDVHETGARAGGAMLNMIRGQTVPTMVHAKLPMVVTGFNGSTQGAGPFARLTADARALESMPGVLSASLFCVGAYIDVPDMGCSAVVVTDGDPDAARGHAERLVRRFWDERQGFVVEILSVCEAVERGRTIDGGPVLLLDTADTTGGGAAGDGIGLVKGLLECGVQERCLSMVVDPDAVQVALGCGVGGYVSVDLGHKLDPAWGDPLRVTGKVVRASDGRFRYSGGILGGVWASMGPSVVIQAGSVSILVMTIPTYDWADEQYRSIGLDPAEAKFVGVKNMMNFRYGYEQTAKGFFVLDLPGPTPPDMRLLPFRRITRPLFPFDQGLVNPAIRYSKGHGAPHCSAGR